MPPRAAALTRNDFLQETRQARGSVQYLKPGARVFRYLSPASHFFVENLVKLNDGLIYFNGRKQFNDPFDCCPVVKARITRTRYLQHGTNLQRRAVTGESPHITLEQRFLAATHEPAALNPKLRQRMRGDLKRFWEDSLDRVGVVCLSTTFHNIALWGLYADCFSGICIEFQPTQGSHLYNCAHVRYAAQRPVMDLSDLSNPPTEDEMYRAMDLSFLVKSDIWQHEDECRCFWWESAMTYHRFNLRDIKRIYFGPKATTDLRGNVRKIFRNNQNIDFVETSLSETEFKIIRK